MNNKQKELYNQQIELIKNYMKEHQPDVLITEKHTEELLLKFLHDKAKDYKVGSMAICKDDLVFGWCVEFYKSEIKDKPKKDNKPKKAVDVNKFENPKDVIKKRDKLKNNDDKFIEDQKEKLKHEGKVLHHCVGGYTDKIINQECIILSYRKVAEKNQPLYTIEVVGNSIRQFRGFKNKEPTRQHKALLKQYCKNKKLNYKGNL